MQTDAGPGAHADERVGVLHRNGERRVAVVKDVAQDDSRALVDRVRTRTDRPVAVGIGVKTRANARDVAAFADGVIVGSAVVGAMADGDPAGAPDRVHALVSELRAGCEE